MWRLGTCLLLAALAGLAGCNRGPRTGLYEAVSAQELAAVDLAYHWDLVVSLERGEHLEHIWHVDENVYGLTDRGRLMAFDATSGLAKWSRDLGPANRRYFAPTHCDHVYLPATLGPGTVVTPPKDASMHQVDVVVVSSTIDAQILDRKDGHLLHRIDYTRSDFAASGPAACDSLRLYVGTVKGSFYALDLRTGLVLWSQDTGGQITAEPRLLGNILLVASRNGKMIATGVGSNTPQRLWPKVGAKPQATGDFSADFVAEERGIFAGSEDYAVYAFEPQSGQTLWRYPTGGALSRPVQVGATNVYAAADNGILYALALEPGRPQEKWTLPAGQLVLAELEGKAYIVDDHHNLIVVDAASGRLDSRLALAGLTLFVPNTKTPTIYAGNRDGLLVRIDPKPRGFLRTEKMPK